MGRVEVGWLVRPAASLALERVTYVYESGWVSTEDVLYPSKKEIHSPHFTLYRVDVDPATWYRQNCMLKSLARWQTLQEKKNV